MWWYRSTLDLVGHTQAGLLGPIVVGQAGSLGPDLKPKDVDKEFFLVMQVRYRLSVCSLTVFMFALVGASEWCYLGLVGTDGLILSDT